MYANKGEHLTTGRFKASENIFFNYFQIRTRDVQFEENEMFALISFVKDNRADLFGSGSKGGYRVEEAKKKAWISCAEAVYISGGTSLREWQKVRHKWNDLQYKAKKYLSKRIGKNITGKCNSYVD